jgi:hypothetical protein
VPEAQDDSGAWSPAEFVKQLEPHERVLIELRDQLYEGSWDRVLSDLRARQRGDPYVFKLSRTIARDIGAIERLQRYEREHQVDLSRLLKGEEAG